MKTIVLSGFALVALLATPANAIPGTGLKKTEAGSNVVQVDYRNCYWRHGHRHCRHHDEASVYIETGEHRRHHHDHDRMDEHHDHEMHGDKGDHDHKKY
jgi:hypothetical protein